MKTTIQNIFISTDIICWLGAILFGVLNNLKMVGSIYPVIFLGLSFIIGIIYLFIYEK